MSTFKWDAADYAKSSSVQQRWARELISKLGLKGNERLLDLGCGDGKVTAEIASLLPDGCVLGVDSSPEMIELACSCFPKAGHPNLHFRVANALNLNFQSQFDVVFSNAVLHWVSDHESVLRGVSDALKPGGRVLLQMGGRGNAAGMIATMDKVCSMSKWHDNFMDFQFPYSFYGVKEYVEWLPHAGLVPVRIELLPKDMAHVDRSAFEGWLRTTWLPYIKRVAEDRRPEFLEQVVDTYLNANPPTSDGVVHVRMMRLEVEAKKE
jgi:trans-aconitate methyltransferase